MSLLPHRLQKERRTQHRLCSHYIPAVCLSQYNHKFLWICWLYWGTCVTKGIAKVLRNISKYCKLHMPTFQSNGDRTSVQEKGTFHLNETYFSFCLTSLPRDPLPSWRVSLVNIWTLLIPPLLSEKPQLLICVSAYRFEKISTFSKA